jgi:hypothetical protein
MRRHSTVPVLDLRAALLAEKGSGRLYHRTDSHWNDAGGLIAYEEIVGALRTWFPTLAPLDRSRYERVVRVTTGGDLAGLLGLVPYLSEERVILTAPPLMQVKEAYPTDLIAARAQFAPRVFTGARGEIATGLVVHDSFFETVALMRSLATHFRRSIFIQRVFPPEIVMDEKPDVVIEEMVERSFTRENFLPESELAEWR